jgi:isocitrate dehydrogenase
MMLEHLGWNEAANLIIHGMEKAIREAVVTYDLARLMRAEGRQDVTEVSCSGFAKAIVERM